MNMVLFLDLAKHANRMMSLLVWLRFQWVCMACACVFVEKWDIQNCVGVHFKKKRKHRLPTHTFTHAKTTLICISSEAASWSCIDELFTMLLILTGTIQIAYEFKKNHWPASWPQRFLLLLFSPLIYEYSVCSDSVDIKPAKIAKSLSLSSGYSLNSIFSSFLSLCLKVKIFLFFFVFILIGMKSRLFMMELFPRLPIQFAVDTRPVLLFHF